MENTKILKQKIEEAITGTLVIENKKSIYITVDRIVKILKSELEVNNG